MTTPMKQKIEGGKTEPLQPEQRTTYTVRYTCSNCGHSGGKELPLGYEVSHGVTCEYCGCSTTNAHKPINNLPTWMTHNL